MQKEYRGVMANYPIEDRVFQEAPFPKTFPFSRAVPRLYAEIRQHVNLSYGFVEDLGLSNTDVDDMVRQATNHLLSKVLSSKSAVVGSTLSSAVVTPPPFPRFHISPGLLAGTAQVRHLTLPQLTQISVNTTHLEVSARLDECRQAACPTKLPSLPLFSQKSCDALEKYITSLTGSIGNDVHNTRLHGADYFKGETFLCVGAKYLVQI
jgi:hypothetical protein